jgi:hypothetical protein
VLTDSEVDRRFLMLLADLNSAVQTVDWPGVSEPAERDLPDDLDAPRPADAGIVALRMLAVATALVTFAVGIVIAQTSGLGIVLIFGWTVLVVPGVTLAALMLVDRLRRSR